MLGSLIVAGSNNPEALSRIVGMLAEEPEKILIVEPSTSEAGEATLLNFGVECEKVYLDGVLGAEPGEVDLVRYNLPGLRSVAEPGRALRDLFPGLRERSRKKVIRHGVAEVFAASDGLPAPVTLRLAELGSEAEILIALEKRGLLERLTLLSLRCGSEALFDKGWSGVKLLGWLAERHFRIESLDESDPDFHEIVLMRDDTAANIAALQAKVAALSAAREADRAAAKEQLKAIETRATVTESKLEARNKLVEQLTAERDAQANMLADVKVSFEDHRKQQEARIAEFEANLAGREKLVVERTAERDASTKASNEAKSALERLGKDTAHRIAELERKLDERNQRVEQLKAENSANAKAHADAYNVLLRQANQAGTALGALQKKSAERIAKLENQLVERQRIVNERTAERNAQVKALADANTSVADQRKLHEERLAALEAKLAESDKVLEQRTTERDAKIEAHRQAEAVLENVRKVMDERISALNARLEADGRVRTGLEKKLKWAETELDANRTALAEDRKELYRMGADLSLALKMQALLSADVEGLREKLRSSELERESHVELLRKLTPRLHQAAKQIREMQLIEAPRLSPVSSGMMAMVQTPAKPKKKGRRNK